MMVLIVAATRYDEEEFWSLSALGQSLERLHRRADPDTRIAYANTKGLPDIYNYFSRRKPFLSHRKGHG